MTAETSAPRNSLLRRATYPVALLVVFLASAEFAARIEGWITYGEAFFGSPDFSDLIIGSESGIKGRPHGRYLDYRLNRHGFRGAEIEDAPPPGARRIMVLSASEGFGTGLGLEDTFPARLARILDGYGPYEVINASVVGMTARSMRGYWEDWASSLRPDIVIIYPNQLFYLNDIPPRPPSSPPVARRHVPAGVSWQFRPRLILRLRGTFEFPRWFQGWRDRRSIARIESSHPRQWTFTSVPEERLRWFLEDLERLTDAVKARGATPVVVTHPLRATSVDRPGDLYDLRHMRTTLPRGTEAIFIEFTRDANREIRRFGQSRGIEVIDLEADLNGDRSAFTDLVHFSPRGAHVAAERIAESIRRRFPPATSRESSLDARD